MTGPSPGEEPGLDSLSLHDYFAARLPDRLQELAAAWESARAAGWTAETARTLHRLAHSLAGAGATFGFPAVSGAARLLEDHLKPVAQGTAPAPDDAAVAELLAGIRHAGQALPDGD